MFVDAVLFLFGFVALIKGADILVDGASSVARRYGVSSFFIGLTVVAFGTSMPEMVVSVYASYTGSAGIALGNIIGSNISNTLLILGITAIIAPLLVKKTTVNKEIPFSLLAVFVVAVLINDFLIDGVLPNSLTRVDGIILILFFIIFMYYTFGISREKESFLEKTVASMETEPKEYSMPISSLMILLGLVGLSLGGKLIVDGAVNIALFFGLSEVLIGLTIVAVGTSLPELATSGMAAYRGKTDIAVGNIVGSNIFNLLWVLGLSAIVSPVVLLPGLNVDFIILFLITILLLFLINFGKKKIIGRVEGIALTGLYFAYIVFIIIRG